MRNKCESVDLAYLSDPITEDNDPYESKFGGSPLSPFASHPVPVSKCQACQNELSFLLQLYHDVLGGKIFYVFACCNPACKQQDWKVLRLSLNGRDGDMIGTGENAPVVGWGGDWGQPLDDSSKTEVKSTLNSNFSPSLPNVSALATKSVATNNNASSNATFSTSTFASTSFGGASFGDSNWGQSEDWGQDFSSPKDATTPTVTNTNSSVADTRIVAVPSTQPSDSQSKLVQKPDSKDDCSFAPFFMEWGVDTGEKPIKESGRKKPETYVETLGSEAYGKEEYEAEDKCNKTYLKKLQLNPSQCLRVGGSPIWIKDEKRLNAKLPACTCGKQRQYEFQLISPLIYYMKPNYSNLEFSFGVVSIFSCVNNCAIAESKGLYSEEFFIKQEDH